MNEQPLLSIVTPTLGKFSDYWLEQLLKVKGNVEFVFVYPPGFSQKNVSDPRVKIVTGPYKGEMMQRFVAFLNTTGKYVLALDDDDYVHPNILQAVEEYFEQFPESFVLRLRTIKIDYKEEESIKAEWSEIPHIKDLKIFPKKPKKEELSISLYELPIVPLDKAFDKRYLVWPFVERRDMRGPHIENFNTKVWRNDLVKEILPDISQSTKLIGCLTWIPASAFDRLMGLFLQAKFYKKGAIVGHWMPHPEQVRYIDKDPVLKPPRFHVASDVLLVRAFPQYGYLWNLFFSKLYGVPRAFGKAMKWKFSKKSMPRSKV